MNVFCSVFFSFFIVSVREPRRDEAIRFGLCFACRRPLRWPGRSSLKDCSSRPPLPCCCWTPKNDKSIHYSSSFLHQRKWSVSQFTSHPVVVPTPGQKALERLRVRMNKQKRCRSGQPYRPDEVVSHHQLSFQTIINNRAKVFFLDTEQKHFVSSGYKSSL